MKTRHSFAISSDLRASVQEVWNHASTFAGVNRELWPLAQMTYPRAKARITPAAFPLGQRALRSWILLFGLIPIDFDDLGLVELQPGRGFHEQSRMMAMSVWIHKRTIDSQGIGCVIRDEISFAPRLRWIGPLFAAVYRLVFEMRHRVLRRLFGARRRQVAGRS